MTSARPRLDTARLQRRQVNDSEENFFLLKTIRQVFASVIIIVLVFAISKINIGVCKSLIASIENTLVYTVDYKKAASEIMEGIKKFTGLFDGEGQDNLSETAQDEENANAGENADAQAD